MFKKEYCEISHSQTCDQCQESVSRKKSLRSTQRTGIYCDMSELKSFDWDVGEIAFVKNTSSKPLSLQGFRVIESPHLSRPDLLLLDMSSMAHCSVTHFLVLSASDLREQLRNLFEIHSWLKILCVRSSSPLQIEELLNESHSKYLFRYLRAEAARGSLMLEYNHFLQVMSQEHDLDYLTTERLLQASSEDISVTQRELPEGLVYRCVSLKISNLTPEVLLWALRGLKADEMLPSEKTIHSRLKEAFDLKVTTNEWQQLLAACRSTPETFSLYSQALFDVYEVCEPAGGQTVLIYPQGEKWLALDQHAKFGDYLELKRTPLWKEFIAFLIDFFEGTATRPPRAPEEPPRSIPGGRYGCAQFIKIAGYASLRQASLGKLSYFIQLALNDEWIKYQRTLVVWAKDFTEETQLLRKNKLEIVQNAILDLLNESPEGVPLAQLPQNLKKVLSFPFSIADVGFAKLKDLLETVPGVIVESRGHNHPFAIMMSMEKRSMSNSKKVRSVVELAAQLLRERPMNPQRLEMLLEIETGQCLEWEDFLVSSLTEFLRNYAKKEILVEEKRDECLIMRREKSRPESLPLPIGSHQYEGRDLKEFFANIRRSQSEFTSSQKSSWWGSEPPPGFE